MTPIESIYEIKSAVIDLQKYLCSKDRSCPNVRRYDMKNGLIDFLGRIKAL